MSDHPQLVVIQSDKHTSIDLALHKGQLGSSSYTISVRDGGHVATFVFDSIHEVHIFAKRLVQQAEEIMAEDA